MASDNRFSNLVQQLKNHPVVIIVGFIVLVGGGVLAGQKYLEDNFGPNAVAGRLESNDEFVKGLSEKLRTSPDFVNRVRGETGPKGDAGERGPAGESPDLQSVVNGLTGSGSFIEAVSGALAEEHSERLRGAAGPRGIEGPAGPSGPPGPPGSISLSNRDIQRVASALVSNKDLIKKIADNLVGPLKPLRIQVNNPDRLSCGTVCDIEFGKADCRGGMVTDILGSNRGVSCVDKARGEKLSCYCAPPVRPR